jgi:dolichol-phosphate mannosyltransferase
VNNKTLIIIPTYNESESIEKIINLIFNNTTNCDVLVVDDNSPDGTSSIVKKMQKTYRNLKLITKTEDKGFSKAYLTGFAYALEHKNKYETVMQMDADGSHQPKFINQLLKARGAGYTYVIGSRWTKGGGVVNWPLKRKILSKGGNIYSRLMLKSNVKDITGGFKAIDINLLELILNNPLQTQGYSFQIELYLRARSLNAYIKEVPIIFVEREQGYSKMSQAIVLEAIKYVTREGIKSFWWKR